MHVPSIDRKYIQPEPRVVGCVYCTVSLNVLEGGFYLLHRQTTIIDALL